MIALSSLPIHVLANRIQSGGLRPSELVAACFDRIRVLDGKLHAFIELYEDALAVSHAADLALQCGNYLGPLHGIPIALKDLLEVQGRRTTGGSLFWRDRVSVVSATVVERMRAAGAIIIGKTHLPEFAFGGWGTNATMGTPWNPWDMKIHRSPGGSSSGSAVAVAAGLVPASLGTDTGGSIRIPSSMCGTVGLKPTFGRISNHGLVPLSPMLDTIGPMTRSVKDAALLFQTVHGPDCDDPTTAGIPRTDVMSNIDRGVRGLRLATPRPHNLEELAPEVEFAFRNALEALRTLGAQVTEIEFPFGEFHRQTGTILGAQGFAVHRDWIEQPGAPFDPNVRQRVLSGKNILAADYLRVVQARAKAQHDVSALLLDFDAVLTPGSPITAAPVAEIDESVTPFSRFTRAVNFLGMCALVVPCGFSADGLPIGLQIIGKPFGEAMILRIGLAYERSTDWHLREPVVSGHLSTPHRTEA